MDVLTEAGEVTANELAGQVQMEVAMIEQRLACESDPLLQPALTIYRDRLKNLEQGILRLAINVVRERSYPDADG